MANTITVRELFSLCSKEIANGNGSKKIFISRDDEGNEFHNLFYGFTDNKDGDISEFMKEGLITDNTVNPDEIIILG